LNEGKDLIGPGSKDIDGSGDSDVERMIGRVAHQVEGVGAIPDSRAANLTAVEKKNAINYGMSLQMTGPNRVAPANLAEETEFQSVGEDGGLVAAAADKPEGLVEGNIEVTEISLADFTDDGGASHRSGLGLSAHLGVLGLDAELDIAIVLGRAGLALLGEGTLGRRWDAGVG